MRWSRAVEVSRCINMHVSQYPIHPNAMNGHVSLIVAVYRSGLALAGQYLTEAKVIFPLLSSPYMISTASRAQVLVLVFWSTIRLLSEIIKSGSCSPIIVRAVERLHEPQRTTKLQPQCRLPLHPPQLPCVGARQLSDPVCCCYTP